MFDAYLQHARAHTHTTHMHTQFKFMSKSNGLMYEITPIIDTLNMYSNVQLKDMGQEFLSISNEKMHSTNSGQWTDYTSYGDVIVYSLYDNFREPGLVPGTDDEGADKLVFNGGTRLVMAAWLT